MPSLGSTAGNLGALVAHLKLDDTELDKGAASAKSKLASVRGEMRSLINTSGKVAVSLGAVGAALVVNMVDKAGAAAREIQNLSRLSNASTRDFQRNAAAAKAYGIEADKLADIYKDLQDRIGDFLQTGGGPLADFFERIAPQVGVTAEQFARLSGPQALQLFVSSLERANLSQSEMTFHMEALAGDSAKLLPLLRDNGKEMERLGDNAERLGRVISDVNLERLAAGKRSLDNLRGAMEAASTQATAAMAPAIQAIADGLNETLADALEDSKDDVVSWGDTFANIIAFAADAAHGAFASIGAAFESGGTTIGAFAAILDQSLAQNYAGAIAIAQAWHSDQKRIWGELAEDTNLTRFRDKLEEIRNRQREIGGEGGAELAGAAGGGPVLGRVGAEDDLGEIGVHAQRRLTGPTTNDIVARMQKRELDDRLEFLRDYVKSEEEILTEQHERRMAMLEEQLAERNGFEEEYRELREALEEEHLDRLNAMRERAATESERFEAMSWQGKLTTVLGTMTKMTAGVANESKAMFEVNKKLALAQAVVSLPAAVLESFKNAGGYPWGIAPAAAMAATGAAQIQAIQSAQFGGGTAPSLAGTTAAPAVSNVGDGGGSRSIFLSGLNPGDLFTGRQVRDLIEAINEETGDGARLVVQ